VSLVFILKPTIATTESQMTRKPRKMPAFQWSLLLTQVGIWRVSYLRVSFVVMHLKKYDNSGDKPRNTFVIREKELEGCIFMGFEKK
jgi:hypothetical protein